MTAKTNIRLLPLAEQYIFIVHFDDGPNDVVAFISKPTYRIRTGIGATSNALLPVASVLNTSVGPNPINKDFLPLARKDSIKSIKSPQLLTANDEIVKMKGIVPLFIRIGDL